MPRLPRVPSVPPDRDYLVINAKTGTVHWRSCWVSDRSVAWIGQYDTALDDDRACEICLPDGIPEICKVDGCPERLDDGEGYDGYCGEHADQAEEAGEWGP